MIELEQFAKEERVMFALDIIELERKRKISMSKAEQTRHIKKLEKLRNEREEFIKSLEK